MSIQTLATVCGDVQSGKNFDVMHSMYHPRSSRWGRREADRREDAGDSEIGQRAAANTIHGEKVLGPYFSGPDEFAVHFTFEVTPKATGQRDAAGGRPVHGQG